MRVEVVTLFPELFETFLSTSFVGRGIAQGALEVERRSLRDFGLGKHKSVDDTPYGGGSGMVMRVDVLAACMESFDAAAAERVEDKARRVLLTPQGAPMTQETAVRLSKLPAVMLLCGRYEGFDERVRGLCDEELSLGDFVMTGGEVAAMAVIEAVVRLLPGVLGNEESTREESHSPETHGLLEYPHYTRPADFRGMTVPEPLVSGDHARIAQWRHDQALQRTKERRPDLFARYQAEKQKP
jgi:tRNA (guanine37-N1)-methyltransferase